MQDFLELLHTFMVIWLLYLLGAMLPLVVYIKKTVKRIVPPRTENWALIMPYFIWFALAGMEVRVKHGPNVIEVICLGLVVSLLYVGFRIYGKKMLHTSKFYLAAACITGPILYFSMPTMQPL